MSLKTFSCQSCNRSFNWKPELAGKRVKCKCGSAISVPQPAVEAEPDDDALYSLAADEEKAALNQPVMVVAAAAAAMPMAAPAKGKTSRSGVPLAYRRGPTPREKSNANALMDPKRDIYVPLGLMVGGMLLYLSHYAIHYSLGSSGIAVVSLGMAIMVCIKTTGLVIFAFAISGLLGVGFGELWTGILKLAAIAIFSDGVTIWVDAGVEKISAGFGAGILSFILGCAIYWGLMTYLFSLDPGDSWMVVIILNFFNFILQWVLFFLLLSVILSWGGVAASSMSSFGGGGGGGSSTVVSPIVTRVDDAKDRNALVDAKSFIADGHQAVCAQFVDKWYAAGAKNVWFEVSRDFDGKRDPDCLIVELPKDKDRRSQCYDVLKDYNDQLKISYKPSEVRDSGEPYIIADLGH